MTPTAAAELLGCYAANADEVARLGGTRRGKRPAAEALQMALWRHRDAIVQVVIDQEHRDRRIRDLIAGLTPFALGAGGIPPHNPVLVSIPMRLNGQLTYVQWRSADFRRAAELVGLDL